MGLIGITLLISLIRYARRTAYFDWGEWFRLLDIKKQIRLIVALLLVSFIGQTIGKSLVGLFT